MKYQPLNKLLKCGVVVRLVEKCWSVCGISATAVCVLGLCPLLLRGVQFYEWSLFTGSVPVPTEPTVFCSSMFISDK